MGLIGILENTRVTLKKVRGLFRNMFIWGKDLFWNIIKGRESFAKRQKSGSALYRIEGRGVWQMCPPSSSSRAEQRRGAPAPALAGGPGHGGGRDQGEKGEGEEGVRFPYSPRAEVVCGGRATVAGGGGRL